MGNLFVNCLENKIDDNFQNTCVYCKVVSSHSEMKCTICKSVFHKQCYLNKTNKTNKPNKCPICDADGSILIWGYVLK